MYAEKTKAVVSYAGTAYAYAKSRLSDDAGSFTEE